MPARKTRYHYSRRHYATRYVGYRSRKESELHAITANAKAARAAISARAKAERAAVHHKYRRALRVSAAGYRHRRVAVLSRHRRRTRSYTTRTIRSMRQTFGIRAPRRPRAPRGQLRLPGF